MNITFDLKTRENQILVAAAAAAVVFVAAYVAFLALPQVKAIIETQRKAASVRNDLAAADAAIGKTDAFRADIAKYNDTIDHYEKMLPAEKEIPALLENLSQMAKDAGVKIVAITPVAVRDDRSAGQIYQEIPILINAKSGYHELGRFIASLENAGRFMKVVDIQIRTGGVVSRQHDVELLVLTYILLKGR